MHGCGSLPSTTNGNSHPQLPQRLAHSGPVRGSFNIAWDPLLQPLMLPGAQGQLCQEHNVTQPTSIIFGHSYQLSADDNNCLSGASHNDSAPHGFLQARDRLSTQSFPENAGPYGRSFASTSVGSASHATHPTWWPIWLKQGGSSAAWCHGRHHVTVTLACVSTLACWRDLLWLKQGVILAQKHRRKVVTKDASNKGWGALCEGKSTFGLWSEEELGMHINCLEMKAVCNACQFFLPDIRRHHVLVRSDSRSVMSYINRQSGLILKRLGTLANGFLVWGQTNLRSLKATHVPRKINEGADLLSRNNVSSEEWMLHPSQFRKSGKSLAELE